jgi:polyisoprenyl-phosphate glycosyltransferase
MVDIVPDKKIISIIIPAYKSSESLAAIYKEVKLIFRDILYNYQIIFVNDSPEYEATDVAFRVLADMDDIGIILVSMKNNCGQHSALMSGLLYATGDFIVTMDDDQQHPVNDVIEMVRVIEKEDETDLIFAVADEDGKKHAWWRNIGSETINILSRRFTKRDIKISAFRCFKGELKNLVIKQYSAFPNLSEYLLKVSKKPVNYKFTHKTRQYGKSNYRLNSLISMMIDYIVNYSSLPLKLLGYTGLSIFILSLLFIIIIIIRRLFFDISLAGYASIVVLISFFGGIQLLGIGIIGEYLIRIIHEQKKIDLEDFSERWIKR